jgi:hypothetical protein
MSCSEFKLLSGYILASFPLCNQCVMLSIKVCNSFLPFTHVVIFPLKMKITDLREMYFTFLVKELMLKSGITFRSRWSQQVLLHNFSGFSYDGFGSSDEWFVSYLTVEKKSPNRSIKVIDSELCLMFQNKQKTQKYW